MITCGVLLGVIGISLFIKSIETAFVRVSAGKKEREQLKIQREERVYLWGAPWCDWDFIIYKIDRSSLGGGGRGDRVYGGLIQTLSFFR